MKVVYLLVTDLHYAETKANRVSYLSEILSIIQGIVQIADKYRQAGHSVKVIFLGDVIDSSMNNADEAMRCIDILRFFISQFDAAYSVVGNHEETYIDSNPFWYLVSSIDDKELQALPRALQPRSVLPCLRIPGVLQDGNVTFYFNHYGIKAKTPEHGGITIGLFHQNVGSNDICKMWGTFDNVEEAAYIQAYRYCFFGHMHMAYGRYYLNEQHTCVCEWLGSCGRANILEVENAPLGVNIPAILIQDGQFIAVEDNEILRATASECINYDRVDMMRETVKQVQELQNTIPHGLTSKTLLASIKDAANIAGVGPVIDMLLGGYQNLQYQYREGLRQVTDASSDFIKEADEQHLTNV